MNNRILIECEMGCLGYKSDIKRLVKHTVRSIKDIPKTAGIGMNTWKRRKESEL
jgi:hypothetical protein